MRITANRPVSQTLNSTPRSNSRLSTMYQPRWCFHIRSIHFPIPSATIHYSELGTRIRSPHVDCIGSPFSTLQVICPLGTTVRGHNGICAIGRRCFGSCVCQPRGATEWNSVLGDSRESFRSCFSWHNHRSRSPTRVSGLEAQVVELFFLPC